MLSFWGGIAKLATPWGATKAAFDPAGTARDIVGGKKKKKKGVPFPFPSLVPPPPKAAKAPKARAPKKGPGIWLFALVGLALVGGGVLLMRRRRAPALAPAQNPRRRLRRR